jgi:hypothetical protein
MPAAMMMQQKHAAATMINAVAGSHCFVYKCISIEEAVQPVKNVGMRDKHLIFRVCVCVCVS